MGLLLLQAKNNSRTGTDISKGTLADLQMVTTADKWKNMGFKYPREILYGTPRRTAS
jgi:hypothetical protein